MSAFTEQFFASFVLSPTDHFIPPFSESVSSTAPSDKKQLPNCCIKWYHAVLLVSVWIEGKCKLLISCNKENLLITSTRERERRRRRNSSSCYTKNKGDCSAIKAGFTSILYWGKGKGWTHSIITKAAMIEHGMVIRGVKKKQNKGEQVKKIIPYIKPSLFSV